MFIFFNFLPPLRDPQTFPAWEYQSLAKAHAPPKNTCKKTIQNRSHLHTNLDALSKEVREVYPAIDSIHREVKHNTTAPKKKPDSLSVEEYKRDQSKEYTQSNAPIAVGS